MYCYTYARQYSRNMIHRLATADKMPKGISFDLDIAYDSNGCDDPVDFDDPSFMGEMQNFSFILDQD